MKNTAFLEIISFTNVYNFGNINSLDAMILVFNNSNEKITQKYF